MENKHVIQAFQEMLTDLPPAEQALKALRFTKRMEEFEAADREASTQHGRAQQGWDINYSENDTDKTADQSKNEHQRGGKRLHGGSPGTNNLLLMIILAVAVVALIVIVVAGILLVSGGSNKSDKSKDSNGTDTESESGYVDSADTEGKSEDDFKTELDPESGINLGTGPQQGQKQEQGEQEQQNQGEEDQGEEDQGQDEQDQNGQDQGKESQEQQDQDQNQD